MPVAPRITQKQVREGLRKDPWRFDRSNPAWEIRVTDVLGGAVTFHEQRHTGTRRVLVRVAAYTGEPGRRWNGVTCESLKDAVAWANEHRQSAVDASAAELDEDFLERT